MCDEWEARPGGTTGQIDAYNVDPVIDSDQVVGNLRIDYNGLAPLENLGTNLRLTRGTPA